MKLKVRYQVLLLLFIVLGVYYPSLFGMANSIDDQKMLQGLLNSDNHYWLDLFLHGSRNNYYRPLLMASFYADRYLWLLEESFMHLENILLHAWNTLMVFWIAREAGKALDLSRGAHWAPLIAALLFALHPVNAEPVNWISGRTDVLAGAFLLPSVWLLLRGLAVNKPFISLAGGLLFLCACLSKETAIFFLPAGMFFCFWTWGNASGRFWRDGFSRATRHYWTWGAALVLYFVLRYAAKPVDKAVAHVVKASGGETYAFLDGLRIFLKTGGFYLKKLFFPWPLNFAIVGVSDWYVGLGIVLFLAIVIWLRRHSLQSMVLLTMACLLSSAMLVPLLQMTWTPFAERYLYLVSAFFAIGLVYSLAPLVQYFTVKQIFACICIPVLGVFMMSTYQRNLVWQNNLALFQDTNRKTPNFPPVRNQLAVALLQSGHTAEAEAIFNENKIKGREGKRDYSPENKALMLWRQGQLEEAGLLFWQAANGNRRNSTSILKKYLQLMDGWSLRGNAKPRPNWLRPEMFRVQESLYARTKDPFWLYRQGKLYLADGDREAALGYFERAYQKAPDHVFYKMPAGRFVENLREGRL
jgi:tetratricopeptide (TPR) repeat protein